MADDKAFTLLERCPPSFEKTAEGVCKLHTLYDQYDSVQDRGVGGLTSSLPARRDGFTPQQIDLGRYLFFDPILSVDGTQSCASCHQPDKGLADGLARSVGVSGVEVSRSAPTLWNAAFLTSFFWDARAKTLEEQMLGPLYDAKEMGNNPVQLLASLNGNQQYQAMFKQAFKSDSDDITLDQIYTALTAFETSLISLFRISYTSFTSCKLLLRVLCKHRTL